MYVGSLFVFLVLQKNLKGRSFAAAKVISL